MIDRLLFARQEGGEWVETGAGSRRRVLLYTDELMMVEFGFEKGAIGALHSYPHLQASYVAEGRFEVKVAGRLIDSFTPHLADFLKP